jgi:hypothetical protein
VGLAPHPDGVSPAAAGPGAGDPSAKGSSGVVHSQEPQGGSGGPRAQLPRCAGPRVPAGDRGARARALRPGLPAGTAPAIAFPYGHTHETQEEVYVVLCGSGRMKLDDEIVEPKQWDAVRSAGYVARLRGWAARPRDPRHRCAQPWRAEDASLNRIRHFRALLARSSRNAAYRGRSTPIVGTECVSAIQKSPANRSVLARNTSEAGVVAMQKVVGSNPISRLPC